MLIVFHVISLHNSSSATSTRIHAVQYCTVAAAIKECTYPTRLTVQLQGPFIAGRVVAGITYIKPVLRANRGYKHLVGSIKAGQRNGPKIRYRQHQYKTHASIVTQYMRICPPKVYAERMGSAVADDVWPSMRWRVIAQPSSR